MTESERCNKAMVNRASMQQMLNLKLQVQELLFLEDFRKSLTFMEKSSERPFVYRQNRIIEIVFFYYQKLFIRKCNKFNWL